MKKTITILLFLISIQSFACSCIKTNDSFKEKISKEFKSSIAIFYGKVIKKRTYKTNQDYLSSADIIFYTFEIVKVYKGEISKKRIIIKSNRGNQACGYSFKLNQKYLVYANYYGIDQENVAKDDLFTSICHRTNLLKKVRKKELRLLKRHSKKRKQRLNT